MADQKISDLVAVTTAPGTYLFELANPGVSNVKISVADFVTQVGGGGTPAGTTGAVQFNNAGSFGADDANFFWDDANNRLGIGTATPQGQLHIGTSVYTDPSVTGFSGAPITVSPNAVNIISEQGWLTSGGSLSYYIQAKHKVSTTKFNVVLNPYGGNVGIGTPTPSAPLHIIGSNQPAMILERAGSTNATIQFQTLTGTVYFGQQASGTFCIGANADLGNTPNFTVVQTTGFVGINQLSPAGMLEINTKLSTNKALIVKAAASQTANLQEWQNSAGTVLSGIAPDGDFVVENASANKPQFRLSGYETGMMLTGNDQINFVNNGITNVAIDNSGASRTFSLAVGVVFGWGSSATAAGIDSGFSRVSAGVIEINNGTAGNYGGLRLASIGVNRATATNVPLAIQTNSTSSDGFYAYNSSGTLVSDFGVTGGGSLRWRFRNAASATAVTINTDGVTNGYLTIDSQLSTAKGLTIKAAASQTANLTEWQNSSGTVLAHVDASGNIKAANSITLNDVSLSSYAGFLYSANKVVLGTQNVVDSAYLINLNTSLSVGGIAARAPSTGTATFFKIENYGGTADTFSINSDGAVITASDIEVTGSANGVILESPDATRWRITVDNTGALTATSL